jgi:hypothetical protein
MSQQSLPAPPLPITSLESLKFKSTQLHESILALQRTIKYGGVDSMPSWPDLLSKYNVLLSQSLNLSVGLVGTTSSGAGGGGVGGKNEVNQYSRIALHPNVPLTDMALDNDLIPLLRNQQTTDVLRLENDTIRRLGERMQTRRVAGVLGLGPTNTTAIQSQDKDAERPTYPQILSELTSIRDAHDARIDRAIRAVTMLRDKYDWKTRVEVEVEEPEELEWDPRKIVFPNANREVEEADGDVDMNGDGTEDGDGDADDGQSSDEDAVDAMVVGDGAASPRSVSASTSTGMSASGGM